MTNIHTIILLAVSLCFLVIRRGYLPTPGHGLFSIWLVGLVSIELRDDELSSLMDGAGQGLVFNTMLSCVVGIFIAEFFVGNRRNNAIVLTERFSRSVSSLDKFFCIIVLLAGVSSLLFAMWSNGFSFYEIRMKNYEGYAERPFEVYCNYVATIGFILIPGLVRGQVFGSKISVGWIGAVLVGMGAQAMSFGGRIYIVVSFVFLIICILSLEEDGVAYLKKKCNFIALVVVFVVGLFSLVEYARQKDGVSRSEYEVGMAVFKPLQYNDLSIAGVGVFSKNAEECDPTYGLELLSGLRQLAVKWSLLDRDVKMDLYGSDAIKRTGGEVHHLGWTQTGAIPAAYADFRGCMYCFWVIISMLSQMFYLRFYKTVGVLGFLSMWSVYCMVYTPQAAHWFSSLSIYVVVVAVMYSYFNKMRPQG